VLIKSAPIATRIPGAKFAMPGRYLERTTRSAASNARRRVTGRTGLLMKSMG